MLPASPIFKELLFYVLRRPKSRNSRSILTLFERILKETQQSTAQEVSNAQSLDHWEGQCTDVRLRKALAHIHQHFSKGQSTGQLAKASGMSVRNLNRIFIRQLGVLPVHVITRFRIERATDWLHEGRFTVTEVALKCGYSSLSQFIAVYRRITGNRPSDLLKVGQK